MQLSTKFISVLMAIVLQGPAIEGTGNVDMQSARTCPGTNPQAICLKVRKVRGAGGQVKNENVSLRSGIPEYGDRNKPKEVTGFNCTAYAGPSLDSETLLAKCCTNDVVLGTDPKDHLKKPVPSTFNDKNCIGGKPN
ncbi:hypothetical protein PGT21_004796 [Puccinia graminis f. sp. tritici]|uniref:Hydrophobin n=1 Tax=Puccinia graminis f. sp. tritici TaxID=56615 RepID=A0A5B0PR37_PUCGR|nr:hypothetical protein PGTUg99_013946 [Puccinia graminis f. sp. tritici]KAA1103038.1 hypothetical protein PGT21_004796 [Puccinia graminis f. sp. tritici]